MKFLRLSKLSNFLNILEFCNVEYLKCIQKLFQNYWNFLKIIRNFWNKITSFLKILEILEIYEIIATFKYLNILEFFYREIFQNYSKTISNFFNCSEHYLKFLKHRLLFEDISNLSHIWLPNVKCLKVFEQLFQNSWNFVKIIWKVWNINFFFNFSQVLRLNSF